MLDSLFQSILVSIPVILQYGFSLCSRKLGQIKLTCPTSVAKGLRLALSSHQFMPQLVAYCVFVNVNIVCNENLPDFQGFQ